MSETKKFLCVWGNGYYKKGQKTVTIEFFKEIDGYRPEYIEQIKNLKIGETADLTEMLAVHTVKRIA